MWANQTARKMATVISVTFIGSLNLHMFVFRSERRRNANERTRYAANRCEGSRAKGSNALGGPVQGSMDQRRSATRALPHRAYLLVPWFNCDSTNVGEICKETPKVTPNRGETLISSKKKFPSFKEENSSEFWKIDKSLEKYHSFKRWTRINVTFVSFLKNINFLF